MFRAEARTRFAWFNLQAGEEWLVEGGGTVVWSRKSLDASRKAVSAGTERISDVSILLPQSTTALRNYSQAKFNT